jgi:multiple sugar transport system substrate-binding protein
MYAGGARVVNPSGDIVLDDDVAAEAMQRYLDIVARRAAPPGSVTAAFADVKKNFVSGLTAMMIHHPGSLKEMQEVLGERLGVVPMPGAGSGSTTLGSMSGNVVLAGSSRHDAAWAWISWLSERDPMTRMCRSGEGQLPVLSSLTELPDYRDEQIGVAMEAIETAQTWPAIPGVTQLASKEWGPTIQRAFQDQISGQQALTTMADVLRQQA